MFQNINGNIEEPVEENIKTKQRTSQIVKTMFTRQNIILYILSFMISTVGFGQNIAPFAIAILASCCSNAIPIGIIYILTGIGTWIGFGSQSFLLYILTSLIFMALILFIRPKEENGKRKLGIHLGIACFIVQAGRMIFDSFLIYDLLESILYAISACVFYKIFTGSICVIKDSAVKKAFSIEEVIGASLIVAIAICGFKEIAIFGYSVRNILCILVILILGWQNGVLIGATSGITIGVVLGIIGNGDPIQVAAYALSGMIAGLLNKLGKIGVVAGFIIGNSILTYVANGNISSIIMLQEIFIASIGLLAVPKTIKIDIEDIYGKTKYLPKVPEKRLEQNEEAIYKLNSVSEAISEVAQTYREVAATVVEENETEEVKNREIFTNEFRNNFDSMENNILYEDLMQDDSEIVKDIFDHIIKYEFIDRTALLTIFANHNNYILGFDDSELSKTLEHDIDEVIRSINYAYRVSKVHFIWKKKIDENKKTMGTQLDGISKVISSIAEDMQEKQNIGENQIEQQQQEIFMILQQKQLEPRNVLVKEEKSGKREINIYLNICQEEELKECKADKIQKILSKFYQEEIVNQQILCPLKEELDECHFKYTTKDKYKMTVGIAKTKKDKSPISGDTYLKLRLEDGKNLLAISDGMGSGPEARKSSKIATQMLKRLLSSGFEKETSIELINSSMCLNTQEDSYATLDIAILDLFKGNIEFIKNGACPTFIKNGKQVDMIKTMSLPAGIIDKIDLTVYDRDICENDLLVMCSDGIIESNSVYENKELWLKYLLEDIQTDNVQKIADIILNEAIDNNIGMAKDDMTVIVAKIVKNN